jgi:hypothetical protein
MPPPSTANTATVPPPSLPVESVKQPQPPAWASAAGAAYEPKERVVATSTAPPPAPPAVPPTPVQQPVVNPTPPPPTRELPILKYVNHPIVTLDYNLKKVGKSGVVGVDLWLTRNDGESWEFYGHDPDKQGSIHEGKHQAIVELPGEGVFGLKLAVKSKAGLGKAPPRAGDVPELRVEVDTKPPIATLFAPVPDSKAPGNLLFRYTAVDKNLSNHPITLEWAEQPDGIWHDIVKDEPNSGRYSWSLPPGLPVRIYMRLRVRDLAGNEGVATTPEPQLIDLSEPEGELIDVSVTPRRP